MAFELPSDPNFWVAVSVAIGTAALAITTALYMVETRKLRQEAEKSRLAAQRPIFALEPSQFLMTLGGPRGGDFLYLNLINHGQPATDIHARCLWLHDEDSGGSSKDFYIVSLAKDGYAGLDVPVREILADKKYLKVELKCKDSVGKEYETSITNSFDKIKGTNTLIAYQNNYWQNQRDGLDKIASALSDTNGKLSSIADKLRR